MDIRRLPDDEAAIRRYIEALWLPYNRELEGIVDGFSLADDVDIVAEELEHRFRLHETESYIQLSDELVLNDDPHKSPNAFSFASGPPVWR